MVSTKQSFKEWLQKPKNYERMYKSLHSKQGFEKYRHISHAKIIEILDTHEFDFPRQVMIPKDAFSEREVFLYQPMDNLILKFYNAYLNEVYACDISKHVYSYQTGISVAKVLRDFASVYNANMCYIKIDLSNYFMTPSGELLETFLDKYGLMEPPFNKLFTNQFYAAKTKELSSKNLGLLPGAPISAFLANAYLKPFDDYVSSHYNNYFRFSDDFIVECTEDSADNMIKDLTSILNSLGLNVNEKKTTVYMPGDNPVFLGSEFSSDGYQISMKRFKKIKSVIKHLAKKSVKTNLPPDERIKYFLSRVYHYIFGSITRDIFRGGVCSAWFSCTSIIDRIQQIDYYILDKCRFVYSKKTNFGALQAGITTEYLENLGFVSLVTRWKQYRQSPMVMALNAFTHFNVFRKPSNKGWFKTAPYDIKGTFDFFNLILQGSDAPIDISQWNINPYDKTITLGTQTLFDSFNTSFSFSPHCKVTIADDYGVIEESQFIEVFKASSYKSLENKGVKTKLFNPMPSNRLPYYSFSDKSRLDIIQLAAGMLFLHNTGRLKIDFSDYQDPYIQYNDDEVKFIIYNDFYNVSNSTN